MKDIYDYFSSHTPEEMALKTDPELEAAFATVKVKYEPTDSDLASQPEEYRKVETGNQKWKLGTTTLSQ